MLFYQLGGSINKTVLADSEHETSEWYF